MENAVFERRQLQRHQQQQPQQSVLYPVIGGMTHLKMKQKSQRDAWQVLAIAQARKQSEGL